MAILADALFYFKIFMVLVCLVLAGFYGRWAWLAAVAHSSKLLADDDGVVPEGAERHLPLLGKTFALGALAWLLYALAIVFLPGQNVLWLPLVLIVTNIPTVILGLARRKAPPPPPDLL